MTKESVQSFDDAVTTKWRAFDGLAGVSFVPLAEPVPDGSIHRARLSRGTVIPPHSHPADEYVLWYQACSKPVVDAASLGPFG